MTGYVIARRAIDRRRFFYLSPNGGWTLALARSIWFSTKAKAETSIGRRRGFVVRKRLP